jgi:hypothetical protein
MKSLGSLLAIYLALGITFAFVLARREQGLVTRATHAVLALAAWPLWAPIALFREPIRASAESGPSALRVLRALEETRAAVRGSALETLLPESTVMAMRSSVTRVSTRLAELAITTSRPEYDVALADARLVRLERSDASPRALATARVHLENARRLTHLYESERRALDELADLCDALRTQLVLARYAGSSLEGIGDIVGEVSARVEGLDSVMHLAPDYELTS